jgi:adenylate cyclase class IV
MPRNIEIKARLANFEDTARIARQLSGADPELIAQEDIFFRARRDV